MQPRENLRGALRALGLELVEQRVDRTIVDDGAEIVVGDVASDVLDRELGQLTCDALGSDHPDHAGERDGGIERGRRACENRGDHAAEDCTRALRGAVEKPRDATAYGG